MEFLSRELHRLDPKEMIVQQSLYETDPATARVLVERKQMLVNQYPDWMFNIDSGRETLERHFGVANLKGFGLGQSPAVAAAGALVDYVASVSQSALPHIRELRSYGAESWVGLDESTGPPRALLEALSRPSILHRSGFRPENRRRTAD